MRQIGIAFAMYLNDSKQRFWDYNGKTDYTTTNDARWFYFVDQKYTGAKFGKNNGTLGTNPIPRTVYFCPVNPPDRYYYVDGTGTHTNFNTGSNYSFNEGLLVLPTTTYWFQGRMSNIKPQTQIALLAEGWFGEGPTFSYNNVRFSWFKNQYNATTNYLGTPHNRGKGTNVLFVDGHVEYLPKPLTQYYIGRSDQGAYPPETWPDPPASQALWVWSQYN
jgi:prepilin-type processing-associated H-X9-DG protein